MSNDRCLHCGGELVRVYSEVTHPGNGEVIKGSYVICGGCGK